MPRTHRTSRKAPRRTPAASRRLSVEYLEDRSLPSTSIPLSGLSWTPLGPAPIDTNGPTPGNLTASGRVVGVAANPTNPNIFFVAAAGGGVDRTLDGGLTWSHLSDSLPGLTEDQRIEFMGSVAVSQSNPNIVYAGEGEETFSGLSFYGRGILKSTDGGNTWALIQGPGNAFDRKAVGRIIISPTDPNIVFAAVTDQAVGATAGSDGVWRSLDGGATWANITVSITGSTTVAFTDIGLDPLNNNVAYVAIGNPGETTVSGIYRTTNALSTSAASPVSWVASLGGNGTFVPGQALGRIQFVVAPSLPSTLYAIASTPQPPTTPGTPPDQFLAIFKSTDSGFNWTQLPTGVVPNPAPTQGNYNLTIAVSPTDPNTVYAAGTGANNVVVTNNGGTTWRSIATGADGKGPHVDCHATTFDASGRLLLGSDGGVYRYDPTTNLWTGVNGSTGPNGLAVTQFIGVAIHPSDANQALGGNQDNGTVRFFDNGLNPVAPKYGWTEVDGGDGGAVFYDPVNPINAYRVSPVGSFGVPNFVRKSTDGGLTWASAAAGIINPNAAQFYPPLALDPSLTTSGGARRLLLGTDVVNETTDSAASWHQMGPNLPFVTAVPPPDGPIPITAIGVGRQLGSIVYAGVADRFDSAHNPPGHFGPAIYVINMAAPVPTWFDVSPGSVFHTLPPPNPPTNGAPEANNLAGSITSITVDPTDSSVIYVTTDNFTGPKIWRGTNFGFGTWTDISGNIPSIPAWTTAVDPNLLAGPTDDIVYAGNDTGVWALTNPTGGPFTWTKIGRDPVTGHDSLPNTQARDLEINTSLGILAVGTHGRGLWEFQIRPYVDGYKFNDLNGDGIREVDALGNPLEPGVAGVTIEAINTATNAIQATTVTDVNGFYAFRSLPNGTYNFREVTPAGTVQTSIDPAPITLTQTVTKRGVNFGNFVLTSISGQKFNDLNGDGIKQPGEPGINGVTIDLENSATNAIIATQLTRTIAGVVGSYSFTNLGPIQDRTVIDPVTGAIKVIPYRIREVVPANSVQTSPIPADITLTSGTPVSNVNFGNFTFTSITGHKFEDHDGSGTQDAGDQGLDGWVIDLLNASTGLPVLDSGGNPIKTTTYTDATFGDGYYHFDNLAPLQIPGNTVAYRVREELKPGWEETTADPADIILTSGTPSTGNDFGNFQLTSITGHKFQDHNGDGIRQAADEGLQGWVIDLLDANGNPVLDSGGNPITATTDNTGTYTFTNLGPLQVPGNGLAYRVREEAQAGWTQTSTPPADITLSSGVPSVGNDFGNFHNTSITVHKFQDHNGNGLLSGGDEGLLNWGFQLINSSTGAVIATQTTDVNGDATFGNLAPLQQGGPGGTIIPYRVREVLQAGWFQTTPNPADITLSSGVPVSGINFGNFRLVSVTGQKFEDHDGNGLQDAGDQGLAGWTIQLINLATGTVAVDPLNNQPIKAVTDSAGNYTLSNVGPGTYQVQEVLQGGWQQTTTPPAAFTTSSGVNTTGVTIGNFQQVTISGEKFEDVNGDGLPGAGDNGVAGFIFDLIDTATNKVVQTSTTDGAGNFVFGGIGPGTFAIREEPQAGWVQTTLNPFDLTTSSGVNTSGITFGNFKLISISGSKFNDLNGDGAQEPGEPNLPGWTVQLINVSTGAVLDSRVTDANGAYSFAGIGPGKFRLREVAQANWLQTSANPADIAPQSGQNVTGEAFGNFRLAAVTGRKFNDLNGNGRQDSGEPGIGGVTVYVLNAATTQIVGSAVTAPDGSYVIQGIPPGPYATREVPVGGFQQTSPALAVFAPQSGQTVTGQDVGNAGLATITGHAYQDTNRNGRRDPGELSRVGVVIQLFGPGGNFLGQTVTAGDGTFAFNYLSAGTYVLKVGPLAPGFIQTQPGPAGYVVNASLGTTSPGNVTGGLEFGVIGTPLFATGADAGGGPQVTVYDYTTGVVKFNFYAYNQNFTGGVRVAVGDVNGDGVDDIITAAGAGGGPHIRVFDGATGNLIREFFAYDPNFTGGVYVAVGDVNRDGIDDIITGAGAGGGPHVKVFDGATGAQIQQFFAYDASFTGGVRVAAADVNGDGAADIITGAGAGGGPHVKVFSGLDGALLQSFFAFDPNNSTGVYVAAGDVNGDGIPDIIVGPGEGTLGSRARVFSGLTSALELEVEAFPPPTNLISTELYSSGVRVGVADRNGDGRLDIAFGSGTNASSRVRFVDGITGAPLDDQAPFDPSFLGGVYVS